VHVTVKSKGASKGIGIGDISAVRPGIIAKIWRITPSAVSVWRKRDGAPVNDDGSFSLPDLIEWREEKFKKAVEDAGPESDWLEKKREMDAKLAELKLNLAKGELVPEAEIEKGRVTRVRALRQAFLGLPARMAPALEGMDRRQIEAILADELRGIITRLAASGDDPSD
jgi:hypothetical protein